MLSDTLRIVLRIGTRTGNFKVSVINAELVDEFLFADLGLERDMVMKVIEAAHIGGLDPHKLMTGRVLAHNGIKHILIIEAFGDNDLEVTLVVANRTEIGLGKNYADYADDDGKEHRNADITHTVCNTDRNGEENACDIACRCGRGAETNEAECSGNGNACAELTVDHCDYRLHDDGKQHESKGQALGIAVIIPVADGDYKAEHERAGHADKKTEVCKTIVDSKDAFKDIHGMTSVKN